MPPSSPACTGTRTEYPERRCSVNREPSSGAYGLQIRGIESPRLQPADPGWPLLSVKRETGADPAPEAPGTVAFGDERATVWIADGGRIDIDRATLAVTIRTPAPISDDAVLHPYLGLPAAFAADWLGRRALHGGAFVHGDGAWALLGDKGGGKSSTLGALLRRGRAILSDDILVARRRSLFAGPRAVDLRDEAAGGPGRRGRWASSGPAAAGGWSRARPRSDDRCAGSSTWGGETRSALEPLAMPRSGCAQLLWHCVLRPTAADALALLDLAALPAWRFERPQRIEALEAGVDQLLGALWLSVEPRLVQQHHACGSPGCPPARRARSASASTSAGSRPEPSHSRAKACTAGPNTARLKPALVRAGQQSLGEQIAEQPRASPPCAREAGRRRPSRIISARTSRFEQRVDDRRRRTARRTARSSRRPPQRRATRASAGAPVPAVRPAPSRRAPARWCTCSWPAGVSHGKPGAFAAPGRLASRARTQRAGDRARVRPPRTRRGRAAATRGATPACRAARRRRRR